MSQDSLLSRLLQGRAQAGPDLQVHLSDRDGPGFPDKMRQAYWWITNNAIISVSVINAPGRKNSAVGTLSVTDALRVFSIRSMVAATQGERPLFEALGSHSVFLAPPSD